jgi:hypothetical protein
MIKTNALVATTVVGFALALGSLGVNVTAFAASQDDIQAPRGQDIERPRGQDLQAPRGRDAEGPAAATTSDPAGRRGSTYRVIRGTKTDS